MKISYLGPIGTNCYEACTIYNEGQDNELIPAKTINYWFLRSIMKKYLRMIASIFQIVYSW